LTVWIPFTRATEENGCLQVIPGSHRRGLVDHCSGKTGYFGLSDRALEGDRTSIPMEPGSVLLMHRHMMHGSLENESHDEVRLSLDLRYQRIGEPTGRPDFPGFVARSVEHPAAELRDAVAWANQWMQAREDLYQSGRNDILYRQWDDQSELCA
jgi:phytanoyl-CoA hydroxylase